MVMGFAPNPALRQSPLDAEQTPGHPALSKRVAALLSLGPRFIRPGRTNSGARPCRAAFKGGAGTLLLLLVPAAAAA